MNRKITSNYTIIVALTHFAQQLRERERYQARRVVIAAESGVSF